MQELDNKVCERCGKKISSEVKGTLTGWLFRENNCDCKLLLESENPMPQAKDNLELTLNQVKVDPVITANYDVLSIIGTGGMGVIIKAKHKILSKFVAIKVLHAQYIHNFSSINRFEQEAKAVSLLNHKAVVAIHEFGFLKAGMPYFIMDYVEGEKLSDYIHNSKNLSIDEIIKFLIPISEALDYAHEKGIIHRDIKPENIILTNNAYDPVKLIDFGIAKIDYEDSQTMHRLTQTGEIFGSFYYMSPEQCKGLKVDKRSDIYSLGCLMYEMFAGKPPFESENVVDTINKHLAQMPKLISKELPKLKYGHKVDAIILKAMAKNPKDRYQSMALIIKDLKKLDFKINESFFQKLINYIELFKLQSKAKNDIKIHPFSIAGVLLSVIVAGVVAYHSGVGSVVNYTDFAKADLDAQNELNSGKIDDANNLYQKLYTMAKNELQHGNSNFIEVSLQELADLKRIKAFLESPDKQSIDEDQAKKYLAKNQELINAKVLKLRNELKENFEALLKNQNLQLQDNIVHNINDIAAQLITNFKEVKFTHEILEKVNQKLLSQSKNKVLIGLPLLRTNYNLASSLLNLGEYNKAKELFINVANSAIASSNNGLENSALIAINSYESAGKASFYLAKFNDAIDCFNLACEKARNKFSFNSAIMAQTKNDLAQALYENGDKESAYREIKSALAIYDNFGNDNKTDRASALLFAGKLANTKKEYKEALNYFSQSLNLLEEIPQEVKGQLPYGIFKNYQYIAQLLINLARVDMNENKFQDARPKLLRALAILMRISPADIVNRNEIMSMLARIYGINDINLLHNISSEINKIIQ